MRRIEIVAFKGCRAALDLRALLEHALREAGEPARVELVIAASPDRARETGLFGSPTVRVDHREYWLGLRGPVGFY